MEDNNIIDLYFQRQESALAETGKKYGAYLNQVAYNILHSREDTEEVVQDTYWAAWRAIPPERPRVLKHFLTRITRNLSFDRLDYRSAKRRDGHMATVLSELDACFPDHRSDLEQIWEAKQIGLCLNRFLGTLDRTDCAIFLCRYYYAMTLTQISQKYEIPQRKIKYRLSILRTQLRKQLEKEGIAL